MSFLKTCFTLLIYGLKSTNSIKGIKLLINGKLKGKPRSDSTLILVGNVSNQTLDSLNFESQDILNQEKIHSMSASKIGVLISHYGEF